MRIFVLARLPSIQLQFLDCLAGCGPVAGALTAFAANTILASTDIVGFPPDPTEGFVTTDCPTGLGIDLPTVGVARDAVSSNGCGVYGKVAKHGRNDQR